MFALSFFWLCCNCFFSFNLCSISLSLLSTVSCNKVNFFIFTILPVRSSTVCFCSMFRDCNSCINESRRCADCQIFSSGAIALGLGIGIDVSYLFHILLNVNFISPKISKILEVCSSRKNMNNSFSSSCSHAKMLSLFSVIFIKSCTAGYCEVYKSSVKCELTTCKRMVHIKISFSFQSGFYLLAYTLNWGLVKGFVGVFFVLLHWCMGIDCSGFQYRAIPLLFLLLACWVIACILVLYLY